jgi:hypothetical protein
MEISQKMKNSYILLRDKKESTALSIEELQEIGLKKTDLIWVECQSMDWRSPFEIAELKDLISAGNSEDKKNSTGELISQKAPSRGDQLYKKTAVKTRTEHFIKNLEKYGHPVRVILSGSEKKEIDFRSDKNFSPLEIEGRHLTNQGQNEQRSKSAFAFQISKQVKKMALYTGLVLTGALLMLLIMNLKNKKSIVARQTKAQPEKHAAVAPGLPGFVNDTSAIAASPISEPVSLTEKNSVREVKEHKKRVRDTNNILLIAGATSANQDSSNNKNDKNVKPVADMTVKLPTIADISSKIGLEANDYNVGALGGIRNLKMTLLNRSRYLLDKVTVELRYLNPDGKIIKTEKLYFQNVQPQDITSLQVDKSKRGVKVEYQVTNIECMAISGRQTGLADPGN